MRLLRYWDFEKISSLYHAWKSLDNSTTMLGMRATKAGGEKACYGSCRDRSRMRREGDSDNVTMIERMDHMCKGGKKDLQRVRHNTLKMYARRCEWKMHLQGP